MLVTKPQYLLNHIQHVPQFSNEKQLVFSKIQADVQPSPTQQFSITSQPQKQSNSKSSSLNSQLKSPLFTNPVLQKSTMSTHPYPAGVNFKSTEQAEPEAMSRQEFYEMLSRDKCFAQVATSNGDQIWIMKGQPADQWQQVGQVQPKQ